MSFLLFLYRRTLGSVVFGISLMVLLAAYIAIGSGLPAVREAFEMNEIQFFRAWPILVLSIGLVLNLICVTVERIPLTPPRYGVWTIHMGVVVLVMGMVCYYTFKSEGLAIVFQGGTTTRYYDMSERALFMRLNTPNGAFQLDPKPLPSLPRFKAYEDPARLAARDLRDILPTIQRPDPDTGKFVPHPVDQSFQLPGELRVDLLAYYPFATIESGPEETGDLTRTSIELTIRDPHGGLPPGHSEQDGHDHPVGEAVITRWISADEPTRRMTPLALGMAEHRKVDDAQIDQLIAAARSLHRLTVRLGDHEQTIQAEVGQTYPIGESGYEITVQSFDPAFQPINAELRAQRPQVPLLRLKIKTPNQTFDRDLVSEWDKPTDWKLGVPGAPPRGVRQAEPLDKDLQIAYTLTDPHGLTSRGGMPGDSGGGLWLILTSPQRMALIMLPANGPVQVHQSSQGSIEFMLGGNVGAPLPVAARRRDGVQLIDRVREIPPELRRPDPNGFNQVVRARVRMGDWSREVAVPFTRWAMEFPRNAAAVPLEGTPYILTLQLGNTPRSLPARVTLDRFELVNYMGGSPETTNLFRDFRSHITLVDRDTGEKRQAVVKMNTPVYFGGLGDSYWTLFQAEWDPEGQRWTVLGVGNRPGVWVMTLGCVMITVGLLWAFYVKPYLIRRMKARALAEAAARGRLPNRKPPAELAEA